MTQRLHRETTAHQNLLSNNIMGTINVCLGVLCQLSHSHPHMLQLFPSFLSLASSLKKTVCRECVCYGCACNYVYVFVCCLVLCLCLCLWLVCITHYSNHDRYTCWCTRYWWRHMCWCNFFLGGGGGICTLMFVDRIDVMMWYCL